MAQGDYGTPSNRQNITSERWEYTPHTSDPPDTEKGDEWLRVDMDSGDKIATVRFQYNSSGDVYNIPVLPSETSDGPVEEVLSFDTPNGVGYVPATNPNQYQAAFPKRRYRSGGTTYALHDATSAIPDSGNLHARFDFSQEDGSMPIEDQSGNGRDLSNGSYSGVSESINGNQAGDFNGSSDHVYSDALSSNVSQPYTIFVVYQRDGTGSGREYAHAEHPSSASGGENEGTFSAQMGLDWNGEFRIFSGSQLGGPTSDTNPHIGGGIFDSTDSAVRLDGAERATGDAGSRNLVGYALGGNRDVSDHLFGGAIGEVLAYDVGASSLDIAVIESYLSDKWGVSL